MYVVLSIRRQETTEPSCGVGKSKEQYVTSAVRSADITRNGIVNMIQLDGAECTS